VKRREPFAVRAGETVKAHDAEAGTRAAGDARSASPGRSGGLQPIRCEMFAALMEILARRTLPVEPRPGPL